MTTELITPPIVKLTSSELEDLKLAVIGQPDINSALSTLKKYYDKNNPLVDINKPFPDLGSFTPLYMATWQGSTKVIEFLLRNRADPNFTMDNLTIPIHSAARHDNATNVFYLLSAGAEVDKESQTGQTALMHACEMGHQEVVRFLLNNTLGIHPDIMKKCNQQKTCMDYALEKGHYETIRLIEYTKLKKNLSHKATDSTKRTKI